MMFRTGMALAAFAALSLLSSPLQAQTNQSGQVIFKTPQEAVRYYEDLVGQLCNQVKAMQDDNAKMVQVINELQRQMQSMNQANQNMAQDVASLKRQIAAESSARQEQMNKVVDRVTGAISSAAAQQKAAAAEEDRDSKASGKSSGEMIEVTVPAGATLSLIAKTYNVSLEDIRKANNLKSDTLRVGQKILVPKK